MRLANMTWVQAKEYFDQNDIVLLCIGSTAVSYTHLTLPTRYSV